MSAHIRYEIHNWSAIVSTIRVLRTSVSAHSPALLTPLPQSIPAKAGHRELYPPTLSLPLCHAPTKPRKQQHIQEPSAGRVRGWRVAEGEGKRSGIERGSGRWRAGERGFFGKGANPITGSGAALVSLAALNSHFNGPFLPLPVPFSFYLCLFLLLFRLFFLIMAHPPPSRASPHTTRLPFPICLPLLVA